MLRIWWLHVWEWSGRKGIEANEMENGESFLQIEYELIACMEAGRKESRKM